MSMQYSVNDMKPVHVRDIGVTRCTTTTQPSYLHNLISLQLPRCTRTSSVVILSRPGARSSLKITNRSFGHASPHLWNKLPASLRQPCLNQSSSPSSSSLSPLSSSITPSLFHYMLKHIFSKDISIHRHLHPLTAYSPDLAPNDCYLFRNLKFYLHGPGLQTMKRQKLLLNCGLKGRTDNSFFKV